MKMKCLFNSVKAVQLILIVLGTQLLLSQTDMVTGKITDMDQMVLPGVNILVKGTTVGTQSDFDGNFSIKAKSGDILIISYLGMKTQEYAVGSSLYIEVKMEEDASLLDEAVVVGYGTQKKINLTGAVDVISSDLLQNRTTSTVSQLLASSASGVSFDYDRNGYQPGAEASLEVRGTGSLNGGAPYVVIDGFPGDMNRLNPEDIESISILKDAAASAIYGARAPYGVILITTKAGAKNKKLSVSYSVTTNIITPARLPGTLDSYTYARVLNEASLNKTSSLNYNEETIDRIRAYQRGDTGYLSSQITEQFPDFPVGQMTNWEAFPTEGGGWSGINNEDPWDYFTGTNIGTSQNFSISGGSEKTSYYFSAGYLDQPSSLKLGNDYFKRFNVSAKINTELTDWWDFRYETRFMKSERHFPNGSRPQDQDTYNALFHIIFNTPPTHPFYTGFGEETQGGRQFFWAGYNDDEKTENWQIVGTELRPAKGWKINADFAYQVVDKYELHDGQEFTTVNWLTGENTSSWYPTQVNEYHYSDYYWSTNLYTSYEKSLNEKHNFLLMGGMQLETSKFRSLNAQARGLIVPEVISLSTATGEPSLQESLSHWSTEGYFGRLTYNFKEKYLFETNIRYDGTSRFQDGKRWGFFPSLSAGWVVSNEPFWEAISPVVNTFKFRGSWGELGNQNVASYQDLALIPTTKSNLGWLPAYNQVGQVGYTLTPGLVSPGLTWETAATTNLGLNLGLFKNKLQFDFDWFERNTTDMIGPSVALPGVLGASAPRSNNASLSTKGWEMALKWKQSFQNGLNYFVNLSLYDAKTIVTEYNNPTGILNSWTWREGQEIGEIWGWSSQGMFKSQEEIDNHVDQSYIFNEWNTGDLKYDDIDGDGKIDQGEGTMDDHGDLVLLGSTTPRYQYVINAGANFKGLDFSMVWKGTGKREKGNYGNQDYAFYGFSRAGWSQPKDDHMDYYRDQPGTEYVGLYEGDANINTDAYYTRPYLDLASNLKNQNYNSWFLANYSFIRLQNVQLGYTLPEKAFPKVNIRFYLSGDNLLTFDHLPKGIDPTIAEGGYRDNAGKDYRADRIYSFGLNLKF
ncbi:SusC/RagA family TonB-linked outer membrane protein [Kriegella aquimaris]|uniref:TonB-linked outer membrane protein, SusC/RagA family n=1 Tax=Kriegella aquimaris TaxID=192904 RepID=A0A1G9VHC0_9FLAO|nr:TonB-dependent receptor [Kriegella aquimaris]SDM71473.1 TonB-linked outer membrane protein, SusC/RagA family [Kriegella aquimaris]